MPSGTYELLDAHGAVRGVEEFRCAPGPVGWRYFSTVVWDQMGSRVDLSVDASWRPVRIRIENDAHHLIIGQRGGSASVLLDDEERAEIAGGSVASFPSPAFLVAATHALPQGGTANAITIDPVTLEPLNEELSYELLGREEQVETPVGIFDADRWRTGNRDLWVAGDVLVSGPGLRLITYDRGGAGPVPR